MKLVVGLGNPEEKYKNTRHNFGFELLEELNRSFGSGQWTFDKKMKSEIVKSQISNLKCILAKPQTYMNESGVAVAAIANFYKVPAEDVIVVHDDLDLPLGKIKVRQGGSGAGHHGVESVIKELGTDQFSRVRLGIGNEKSHENFVLEKFSPKERSEVKQMIKQGIKAIEIIFDQGIESAQNQFN